MKYDVAIIGGGPAGYTAAEKASKAKLKTILFEKENLGGVCLNEGCIPTKTILYSAKIFDYCKTSKKYGVNINDYTFDLGRIVARKNKVVRKLVLGVKAKLNNEYSTIINGKAEILDQNHIKCNDEIYEFENILICTGSQTFIPPIEGLKDVDYWTHRDALNSKELPKSLTIIGGGVIGMEFASFYNSMGTKVSVIEMMDEILNGIDNELSALLRKEYSKKGIDFLLGNRVTKIVNEEGNIVTYSEKENETIKTASDKILISVGRRPITENFGLEKLNLNINSRKQITVNEKMQSSVSNIYICGDINGNSLLAHTAVKEAEVAINTILNIDDKINYKSVPGIVYTNPEVSGVGYTEEELIKESIEYKATKIPLTYSGRFVAENEGFNGLCKLLISPEEKILGAHILGNPSSELVAIISLCIDKDIKLPELKKTIFPHPTVSEIFKDIE